jgi:hypothetical protein
MTRNYALFVGCIAALVLAVPFVDRNDWQGWVSLFVMLAAMTGMAGMWLYRTADTVLEWWHDRS